MKYSIKNVIGNGGFACKHFILTLAEGYQEMWIILWLFDNCDKSIPNAVKRKDVHVYQFETNSVHIYFLRPKVFIGLSYIYERPILMGRLNLIMFKFGKCAHFHLICIKCVHFHLICIKCKKMRAFSQKCKKMRAFSRKTLTR